MHSSLLGEDESPLNPPGHSIADLGPSDLSDTGSDTVGEAGRDTDSDSMGTGERSSVELENPPDPDQDIEPDLITDDPGGMLWGSDPEGVGLSSDHDRDRASDRDLTRQDGGKGTTLGPDQGVDAPPPRDGRRDDQRGTD